MSARLNLYVRTALLLIMGISSLSETYAQARLQAELKDYLAKTPFPMTAPQLPVIPAHVKSIVEFGAIGDGHTLNTDAISRTIAAVADQGGGTVEIPPGLWLTGPIELKSRINLHLDRGAIVLFSTDHSLYPLMTTSASSHTIFVMPPVYGYKLHDIAITGDGIMNGSGDSWRPVKKEKMTQSQWDDLVKGGGVVSPDGRMWWPSAEAMHGEAFLKSIHKPSKQRTPADYLPARDFLRPYMISLISCTRVLLDGPTFMNSPKFALYPKYCSDLVIRDVKINNEWYAQNGDGIDLANCTRAMVYKCTVNAGDDGICMKSSRPSSDQTDTACLKDILIADCVVYHAHGGFVIGSNTDGGMRRISVQHCDFINTDVGIRVKSGRGRGGLVHQVYLKGIYMANIQHEAVLFNTYYEQKQPQTEKRPVTPTTPRFQDFYLDSIYCQGAGAAISLTGLPEKPLTRIHFSQSQITARSGISAADTSLITFSHVKINHHAFNQ